MRVLRRVQANSPPTGVPSGTVLRHPALRRLRRDVARPTVFNRADDIYPDPGRRGWSVANDHHRKRLIRIQND